MPESSDLQKAVPCRVSYKQGHVPSLNFFHAHDFYEISLILTGEITILLRGRKENVPTPCLVLSAPSIPHLVFLSQPSYYSRINLYFQPEFLTNSIREWSALSRVFGRNGNVIALTNTQKEYCEQQLALIHEEPDLLRKKLQILLFLSQISEFDQGHAEPHTEQIPSYVLDCLQYMDIHYSERLVAEDLAGRFGVGRTTLMTHIKQHTGLTFSEYLTRLRIQKAVVLLRQGISQEEAAIQTGFGSGGGIIRAFRRCYAMTPRQYMRENFPYLFTKLY